MMKRIYKASMTLLLFTSLNLLSACGEDFVPESLLDNTRILAVVAEPIAPGFDDEITLQPVLHIPEGGSVISESWTFCPITIGASFGFACVAEECITEIEGAEDPLGPVTAKPGPLLIDCVTNVLANMGETGGNKEEEPSAPSGTEDIPEMVETVFRYTAVVEEVQADGSVATVERKALTRVNLHFEEPPVNRNPEFESIEIGGVELNLSGEETGLTLTGANDLVEKCSYGNCEKIKREFSVILKVKESSLDTYYNEAYDKDEIEETEVFWYVTAGRVSQEEENNLEIEGAWSFSKLSVEQQEALNDGSLEASLYVVLRDGEGGQASYGPFSFLVEP